MAADLGRRLLGERVVVGMDEVLNSLRILARSSELPQEDISSLTFDDMLNPAWQAHQDKEPRRPVVEICSNKSGAGKSQLVYLLVAIVILPDVHGTTILDGKESAIIFLDTEDRFDVQRLVQVMTLYIDSKSLQAAIDDREDLIQKSLHHVHIYRPETMQALLEMLPHIADYIFNSPAHHSQQRKIHSVIFDNASAFYWQIRAGSEDHAIASLGSKPNMAAPPFLNPYTELLLHLRSLAERFDCAIVATTTHISTFRDQMSGEPIFRTLPAPWSSLPTKRILTRRQLANKLAVGNSWEDVVEKKEAKQAEVQATLFVAELIGGQGMFRYSVTEDGVRIVGEEDHITNEE